MTLLRLFFVFFKVGLFAIGGAYSFLPLVQREAVEGHGWLSKDEFAEVTGMVELFPGAISIKFATYTGYKVAGIPGAVVANVANLLPPVLFMAMASWLYLKWGKTPAVQGALLMVRYAVIAMIVAVAVRLVHVNQLTDLKVLAVVIVAFLLLVVAKIHPAFVIIAAAVYGALVK
jgi:chromate transporter